MFEDTVFALDPKRRQYLLPSKLLTVYIDNLTNLLKIFSQLHLWQLADKS